MRNIFSFVAVLWLGLLLGVSFFSAPIKFKAAGLTKAVALQIGDVSFQYFNYIEWFLFILLVVSLLFYLSSATKAKLLIALSLSLFLVLVMDSFYLLPNLHDYVVAFNEQGAAGNIDLEHKLYVFGDCWKLIALGLLYKYSF